MGSRQHEHVRVLVVDDEPQLRRALERALKLEGYEVELAADGEQALGSIASAPMDAIVLDVLMPKRDGLEVARELRARGDRTPILMLTARDAVQDRVDGLDAGADDYVVKPFALEELLARLQGPAPADERRRRRAAQLLGPDARPGHPRGVPRRSAGAAHQDGVRAARAPDASSASRAEPVPAVRGRLGLRLRPALELARGLHRLPAPQDGGGRRAALDPDRARGRILPRAAK